MAACQEGEDGCNVDRGDKPSDKLLGYIYESLDEAYEYYKAYGSSKGFNVRRNMTRHDAAGKVIIQEFCCAKQGFRKKRIKDEGRKLPPRPTTRTGCNAKVRVVMVDSNKWQIAYADDVHNHDLCHPQHRVLLRANRGLTEGDRAEALAMKASGVRTANIYSYFVYSRGGIDKVGFLPKDLYNALQAEAHAEILEGDVNALLGYFAAKEDSDLGFYIDYTVDADNRLHNVFWTDSTSRSDYFLFGDVIAFDTTYKNNAYDRPLRPIVGLNQHHQTVVFGIAVLADQTTSTFEWVLNSFMNAMQENTPTSIVTDGDRAMERAIKSIMPNARHRLCSWHLSRNAQTNIGVGNFVKQFSRAMKQWWTEHEFENHWQWMVTELNVKDHPWVKEKYKTHAIWAQAYLTGTFFGTLTTTQRCESMNASLKIYLESKKTYLDFVRAIEDGIVKIRQEEAQLDYKSTNTMPDISMVLTDLEAHAADLLTRKSFTYFQKELKDEALYRVAEPTTMVDGTHTYYLTKYKSGGRRIRVEFDVAAETMRCGCQKMEALGFPCAHLLHVLKLEDMTRIPDSLILNRWTKNVKLIVPSVVDDHMDPEMVRRRRYGSLNVLSSKLHYFGSLTDENFIQISGVVRQNTSDYENSYKVPSCGTQPRKSTHNVGHPVRKKSKGKEKLKKSSIVRKCTICGREGHNKTTCPNVNLNLASPSLPCYSDIDENGATFLHHQTINNEKQKRVPVEEDKIYEGAGFFVKPDVEEMHNSFRSWEESNNTAWDFLGW